MDPLGLASFCDALKELAELEEKNGNDYIWGSLSMHPSLKDGENSGSEDYNYKDRNGEYVDISYTDTVYRAERQTANSGVGYLSMLLWANTVGRIPSSRAGAPSSSNNASQNTRGANHGARAAMYPSLMAYWKMECESRKDDIGNENNESSCEGASGFPNLPGMSSPPRNTYVSPDGSTSDSIR